MKKITAFLLAATIAASLSACSESRENMQPSLPPLSLDDYPTVAPIEDSPNDFATLPELSKHEEHLVEMFGESALDYEVEVRELNAVSGAENIASYPLFDIFISDNPVYIPLPDPEKVLNIGYGEKWPLIADKFDWDYGDYRASTIIEYANRSENDWTTFVLRWNPSIDGTELKGRSLVTIRLSRKVGEDGVTDKYVSNIDGLMQDPNRDKSDSDILHGAYGGYYAGATIKHDESGVFRDVDIEYGTNISRCILLDDRSYYILDVRVLTTVDTTNGISIPDEDLDMFIELANNECKSVEDYIFTLYGMSSELESIRAGELN